MLRVSVLTVATALAACAAVPVQPQAEMDRTAPAASAPPAAVTATATATTATDEPASAALPPGAGAIWPPRMPSAGHFDEVPLGKWADYEESYLEAATIHERVALVAREADAVTLETTTETRPGDRTVFATVFAGRDNGWRVTSNVIQVDDEDPMEAPASGPAQQPYPRVDQKKLIGEEMVSVRAGLFKAKHYRYRTAYGERVDFWIDDSVAPIGLVKLEAEQKQHAGFRGGFKFELVETGSGAIPQVTRPARPFDEALLARRGLPWTRQARVGPQPPAKVVQ
jgi:hypothetical protein